MKKVQHEKVKYEKLSKVRHCSAQTDNGHTIALAVYTEMIKSGAKYQNIFLTL